jgi:alpha-tubulin suppressor-like RCC1 family protein
MYRVSARGTDLNSISREQENEIVYRPGKKPSTLLEGRIAAGFHTAIILGDGHVYTWGRNNFGALGDNSTSSKSVPVQVVGVGGSGVLSGIESITAGSFSNTVIKDGFVYAWGRGDKGQLGDNTAANRSIPVQVLGIGGAGYLSDIVKVSTGHYFTLGLTNYGTLYAWGHGANGQLGDGFSVQRNTPVKVKGIGGSGFLEDVVDVCAAGYHSIALKSDGTVYAWGAGVDGRLGDGFATNRSTPVQVKGVGGVGFLSDVISVGGGQNSSFALKRDGTV